MEVTRSSVFASATFVYAILCVVAEFGYMPSPTLNETTASTSQLFVCITVKHRCVAGNKIHTQCV